MSRATRTLLVVAIALTVATIASYAVFRAVERIPVKQVEIATAYAVVAAKPLPTGAVLTKDDVRLVAWPARNPVAGGFSSTEAVVGRGLLSVVVENEPITERNLAPREAGGGLPPTIPMGMRAISVRVNEVIGVAGFVVPGTRVDVIASVGNQQEAMTRTVVGNVQVLTAGTRYDQAESKDGKPIPTTVVTLLATPQDAERIALAAGDGRIVLALRNPMDTQPTQTSGIRMAALMGPASPPPLEKTVQGRRVVKAVAPPPPPPAPRLYTVETIRAAKRSEEVVK